MLKSLIQWLALGWPWRAGLNAQPYWLLRWWPYSEGREPAARPTPLAAG